MGKSRIIIKLSLEDREALALMSILQEFVKREYHNVQVEKIAKSVLKIKFNVAVSTFQKLDDQLKSFGGGVAHSGLVLPRSLS